MKYRNMKEDFIKTIRDEEYLYKVLGKSDEEIKKATEIKRKNYLVATKREIDKRIDDLEKCRITDNVELLKVSSNITLNIRFYRLLNIEEDKEIIEFCDKAELKEECLYKLNNIRISKIKKESDYEFDIRDWVY